MGYFQKKIKSRSFYYLEKRGLFSTGYIGTSESESEVKFESVALKCEPKPSFASQEEF